ncbi:unnamed protein product [Closterium sp. Naga37s-1]|nr:unnamed protein product [Closterium sp. Naga37s-1]
MLQLSRTSDFRADARRLHVVQTLPFPRFPHPPYLPSHIFPSSRQISPLSPPISPRSPVSHTHVLTQLSSSLSPSYLSSPSLLTYIPSSLTPHLLMIQPSSPPPFPRSPLDFPPFSQASPLTPVNSLLFTLHLPPASLPPSPPASYPPALTLISSLTHTSSSYPLTPHLPSPLTHHLSRHSPGHSSSAPRSFPLSPPPPSLSLFLCPSSQVFMDFLTHGCM